MGTLGTMGAYTRFTSGLALPLAVTHPSQAALLRP